MLSKNKTAKWIVVYHGGDMGTEYLDEAEHAAFMKAYKTSAPHAILKDGRVISTNCQRVIPNPEYIDPVEDERKTHYYFMWNKYQALKQSGAFGDRYEREPDFKFGKWYKENKKTLEEEYAHKK